MFSLVLNLCILSKLRRKKTKQKETNKKTKLQFTLKTIQSSDGTLTCG